MKYKKKCTSQQYNRLQNYSKLSNEVPIIPLKLSPVNLKLQGESKYTKNPKEDLIFIYIKLFLEKGYP